MTTFQRITDSPVHLQWMAETPDIQHLRIDELILPGTHNSGSDKQSPNLGLPQEYAQDQSPLEQLRHGVRVLDLRVTFKDDYPEGDPQRFQLFHLTSSGRTVAEDIVDAVRAFFAELESSGQIARDIVILDFHQFENFTDQAHQQLQALVFNELGARVIPYAMHGWTLEQIWQHEPGRNVVVAYNRDDAWQEAWDGVNQRWPGENLFNTNTLKAFINEVAAENQSVAAATEQQSQVIQALDEDILQLTSLNQEEDGNLQQSMSSCDQLQHQFERLNTLVSRFRL